LIQKLENQLKKALSELNEAMSLFWHHPIVLSRFHNTGKISKKACTDLGLVGPSARASGVIRDTRLHFPSGIYKKEKIKICTSDSGDVFARASVRWLEIQESISFILKLLKSMPENSVKAHIPHLEKNTLAISFVEGWRGEIAHVALTDEREKFVFYKIIDPSFHNWQGLAMAMRDQQISDFPLCNKSFNLSYCGHDL